MTISPQDRINGSAEKPTQPSSEMKTTPAPVATAACPFIGLEDDPDTRFLFASPAACCHRADPVSAIDLGHQQTYCLTSVYTLCPVFMRVEWSPLPVALAYHDRVSRPSKRGWLWLVIGLVIVGLMFGAWFVWDNGRFSAPVEPEPEDAMPIVVIAPSKTPTFTPTVVESPTSLPTKTAVPSATPVPTHTNTPQPTATPVPTVTPILPTETAVPLLNAVVAVPNLNVRLGPSTAYELLGTIAEGEQIELTGRILDSSWWQICCVNGEPGWVIGEAIDIPEGAENIVPRVARIPAPPTPTR
jgi:hypothetical protein